MLWLTSHNDSSMGKRLRAMQGREASVEARRPVGGCVSELGGR